MKKRPQSTRIPAACLIALAALGTAPFAQDEKPELPEELFPQNDMQKELLDLFHKVERNLERIDGELNDAGAGVAPLDAVEDSGLDDLLRSAQSRSQQVMRDIDRILKIAEEMGQGQSLGSCTNPQPGTGEASPLDEERDTGPQERERTPEGPGDEPKEPQGNKPEDGEKPDSPEENPPGGENRPGNEQDHPQGPGSADSNDAERWGELPTRYQETFRNQGADDMPVQYRDWIDAYYRRLSRSQSQR